MRWQADCLMVPLPNTTNTPQFRTYCEWYQIWRPPYVWSIVYSHWLHRILWFSFRMAMDAYLMGINSGSQRQHSPLHFSSFIIGQVGFWNLRYYPLVHLFFLCILFLTPTFFLKMNSSYSSLFFQLIAYTDLFCFPSLTLRLCNSVFPISAKLLFPKSHVYYRLRIKGVGKKWETRPGGGRGGQPSP